MRSNCTNSVNNLKSVKYYLDYFVWFILSSCEKGRVGAFVIGKIYSNYSVLWMSIRHICLLVFHTQCMSVISFFYLLVLSHQPPNRYRVIFLWEFFIWRFQINCVNWRFSHFDVTTVWLQYVECCDVVMCWIRQSSLEGRGYLLEYRNGLRFSLLAWK